MFKLKQKRITVTIKCGDIYAFVRFYFWAVTVCLKFSLNASLMYLFIIDFKSATDFFRYHTAFSN